MQPFRCRGRPVSTAAGLLVSPSWRFSAGGLGVGASLMDVSTFGNLFLFVRKVWSSVCGDNSCFRPGNCHCWLFIQDAVSTSSMCTGLARSINRWIDRWYKGPQSHWKSASWRNLLRNLLKSLRAWLSVPRHALRICFPWKCRLAAVVRREQLEGKAAVQLGA